MLKRQFSVAKEQNTKHGFQLKDDQSEKLQHFFFRFLQSFNESKDALSATRFLDIFFG